jgi:hypothetical protein
VRGEHLDNSSSNSNSQEEEGVLVIILLLLLLLVVVVVVAFSTENVGTLEAASSVLIEPENRLSFFLKLDVMVRRRGLGGE